MRWLEITKIDGYPLIPTARGPTNLVGHFTQMRNREIAVLPTQADFGRDLEVQKGQKSKHDRRRGGISKRGKSVQNVKEVYNFKSKAIIFLLTSSK